MVKLGIPMELEELTPAWLTEARAPVNLLVGRGAS